MIYVYSEKSRTEFNFNSLVPEIFKESKIILYLLVAGKCIFTRNYKILMIVKQNSNSYIMLCFKFCYLFEECKKIFGHDFAKS